MAAVKTTAIAKKGTPIGSSTTIGSTPATATSEATNISIRIIDAAVRDDGTRHRTQPAAVIVVRAALPPAEEQRLSLAIEQPPDPAAPERLPAPREPAHPCLCAHASGCCTATRQAIRSPPQRPFERVLEARSSDLFAPKVVSVTADGGSVDEEAVCVLPARGAAALRTSHLPTFHLTRSHRTKLQHRLSRPAWCDLLNLGDDLPNKGTEKIHIDRNGGG
mmetsp:Transcript_48285/g.104595  ORF Transcript_48285/g.104595 Transcript_48285/m.104595 type:complete len:220 (-) Transcript_48285:314-973(-)